MKKISMIHSSKSVYMTLNKYVILNSHGLMILLIIYLQVFSLRNSLISKKRNSFSDLKNYFWEDPFLFRICADQMICRCIFQAKGWKSLKHCHFGPTGGHYQANETARKALEAGFYWPCLFKDAQSYVKSCDNCQRIGNISFRDEMP